MTGLHASQCQQKGTRFLGALRRARIKSVICGSYGLTKLPGALHRSRSEALLSVAEAQVQKASTAFTLA